MMLLTTELLRAATGCTADAADRYAMPLAQACAYFGIDTPARLAAFLAQLAHESGSLRHVREIWGPTPAQRTYEGRRALGNVQPGDGERFMGRGLIQVTGRANYAAARDRLRHEFGAAEVPDFEAQPQALEDPRWACLTAADYWAANRLNELADAGNFEAITRRINGGLNGQADRLERWERAKAAVATHAPAAAPTPPVRDPDAPLSHPTHWPAGESPYWPDDTPKEKPVAAIAPIIGAVLPYIVEAIPRLGSLFGSGSKVAERNLKAAETVVGIVQTATGAINAQDAAERIRSDPAALAAATRAIETHWFDIHKAAEDSAAAARQFGVEYAKDHSVRVVWGNLTFLELLSLLLIVSTLGGGLAAILWGGIDAQLKGAIVTLMLIGGYTAVTQFWFGSSLGSKKKDDKAP